jgi:membrane protease YdiL (CAAX protease family)
MNSKLFNLKSLSKGIGYLVLFFILPSIIQIPFNFIKNNISLSYNLEFIIVYLITTIIFMIIIKKDLKENIKTFNIKILKKSLIYWLIGLSIMIISSELIELIGIPLNSNEEAIRAILKEAPITQILHSIVFAPILEEIVFRYSFKDLSSNKHIYALFTGIFFALMHLPDAFVNHTMLIHLIPYSALGIAFGYIYKNTDNILATIIPHSLHNLISILQLFIIGG